MREMLREYKEKRGFMKGEESFSGEGVESHSKKAEGNDGVRDEGLWGSSGGMLSGRKRIGDLEE